VPDASPFLEIQRVIVTPHLGTLLHGDRIVDVVLEAPTLTYVVGPTPATSQTGIDPEWVAAVLRQYPATLDHLRIVRGTVSYHDASASPDVALSLTGLDVIGTNFANLTHVPQEKFAHLTAKGNVLESGALDLDMDLAPYEKAPMFTLHADVRHVPLVQMNNALRAYGNFDVQAGSASVAIAMTAAGGSYSGKVDPVLTDVKVVKLGDEPELKKRPLRFAWEAIIGTAKDVAEVVTPGPNDQVRLPLEIHGRFDGPSLLTNLVDILPKAWFGSLLHAFGTTEAAGEKADRLRKEAVPIAERESQAAR